MPRELLYFDQDEWEISLILTAECLGRHNGSWADMKKLYNADPLFYYKQAKKSPLFLPGFELWNWISCYPIETEQRIIKCLGVLRASDDDPELTKRILRIIKHVWPEGYAAFSKINNKTWNDYQYCKNNLFNNTTGYLLETIFHSASGDKSRMNDLFSLCHESYKKETEKRNVRTCPPGPLEQNEKAFVELFFDPIVFIKSVDEWREWIDTDEECLEEKSPYYFKRDLVVDALFRYKRQKGQQEDILFDISVNDIHSLVSNLFWSRGIVFAPFFNTNLDYSHLSEIALQFSGFYYRTLREQDVECAAFDPTFADEVGFEPTWFIFCYYILCLIENYKALKAETRKLQTEEAAIEKDLAEDELRQTKLALEQQQRENRQLQDELTRLKEKLAGYEKKNRVDQWAQEKELRSEIELLRNELRDKEDDRAELIRLREFFFEQQNGLPYPAEEKADKKTVIASKKIAVIGGHILLRNNLKKAFPNILILDGTLKTQDLSYLQNMDAVFLITSNMSHSVYYALMSVLKKNHVPFSYISATNTEMIGESITGFLLSNNMES